MVLIKRSMTRVTVCASHLGTFQSSTFHLRGYASVSEPPTNDDLRWPIPVALNRIPTPYQILRHKRGSVYSKHEFYKLVKVYHPDRCQNAASLAGLSHATMIERYRLVVAAHEILVDPTRKAAYDRNREGWGDSGGPRGFQTQSHPATWKHTRKTWSNPNSPFGNATWEDWERWYRRNDVMHQRPTYTSNSAFVSLIIAFAVVGGMLQSMRLDHYSMNYFARQGDLHKLMSKDLGQRRQGMREREDRIDSFLTERDAWAFAQTGSNEEEDHRKILPPPEICSSEQIKQGKG